MQGNNSLNDTEPVVLLRLSKPVAGVMRTQGLVIVTLNLIVVVTLAVKKSKFPSVYWLQLLCLATNDTLAGFANFLISFIDLPYIGDSMTNCVSIIVFMYTCQSASLYNIFGICIHRFLVLKRFNYTGFMWKRYYTIFCTVIAWTLSALLCSMPIILYHKSEDYARIKYCSFKPLFGVDIRKAILIMVVGSFICPLLCINIIYIILFCTLRYTQNQIRPQAPGQLSSITSSSHPKTTPSASTSRDTHGTHDTVLVVSVNEQDNTEESLPRTSTSALDKNKYLCVPDTKDRHTTGIRNVLSSIGPNSSAKQLDVRAAVPQLSLSTQRQRKAFTLLGVILLFLNILSLPGIASLVMTSMVRSVKLSRNVLLPLFATISLNSAVNPLLYAVRIPEFRESLKEILHSLYKLVTCKK